MSPRNRQPPRPNPRPTVRRAPGAPRGAVGVDAWLDGAGGSLAALQAGAAVAGRALEAARQVLPADLAPHLWAANCVAGEFSLLFESAAWATRARYAAGEWREPLGRAMGETVEKVSVKVRPRG